jgi:hypothetical protein
MLDLKTLYIEQLKKSLMNIINIQVPDTIINPNSLNEQLSTEWFEHFWLGSALTMSSLKRLDNIQYCLENCLSAGVQGNFIECGAWRGGGAILMRGILAAHGITDRTVWVADSFQGLPLPPDASVDESMYNYPEVIKTNRFAVTLEEVKSNFDRYGLLDEQVHFLAGWFNETLPNAPVQKIALLRLDGDYYDSTMDTLVNLYPKVTLGGYIIIDDWGLNELCGEKQAVIDYRQANRITDEMISVDYHSAYWQKTA